MKPNLALLFVLIFCITTQFDKVAFASSEKIPYNEIKAIACIVENRSTGVTDEIDRMPFTGIGGLWALNNKCEKNAKEYAKQESLSAWKYLCCPITADDEVHCDSPLGSHGKY